MKIERTPPCSRCLHDACRGACSRCKSCKRNAVEARRPRPPLRCSGCVATETHALGMPKGWWHHRRPDGSYAVLCPRCSRKAKRSGLATASRPAVSSS